jgi:predicted nucleic acid-binding protein
MKTYVDSSALVPIYVPERFSDAARSIVQSTGQVPFTALHRLEIPNAFALLVGRKLLTKDEQRAVLAHLDSDLDQQRLVSISLDLERVFSDAADLSQRHTATHLTRSLDLLHVAAAHAALCTRFVSADDRQLRLAKATGLRTVDIKQHVSRRRTSR